MELHDYQKYAVRFIEEHPIAALFLDMGLGKTITTLTAIHNLMFDLFAVRKVLIIAPLRVARDTWSAEIEKWEHLEASAIQRSGRYSRRTPCRLERTCRPLHHQPGKCGLARQATRMFDYDMVVIDELIQL